MYVHMTPEMVPVCADLTAMFYVTTKPALLPSGVGEAAGQRFNSGWLIKHTV